jgi:uncharacterized protein (TIGR03437 family)
MRTTRMYRTIFLFSSALLVALAPVKAQSFDTSGTANLTGAYLFRYVNFFNDQNGNLTESCTLTGTMTFNGKGNYTLSNTQLADSMGTGGTGSCASLGGGTYGVQSNGLAQLDNPLYQATLFGAFSQPVLIASSTEDDYFDLFIAVQAPAASSSNGILSGAFTVGTLDFPTASATLARQGYFTINADGQGNIAAFTVNGSLANVSQGATLTQNVAASTYSLSGATGGTVTFPGSSTSETEIVSGAKVLYVSADGNWFVGGTAQGSDMFFGFRAPSGTSSNSLLTGTYFSAGIEDALPGSVNFLDAFYGSINTNGNGNLITHERYDEVVQLFTYDNTFNTPITIGADGSYYDGSTYTYLAGSNGQALMLIGSNQQFSLIIGVHAPGFAPTPTLWLNPIGITNAANFTPITNAYTPGELVTLYGNFNGASNEVASALPISTMLGGVQVFVNGTAAPVYSVSENQISALIPYELSGDYFATFQVEVNGSKSDMVTVYLDNSAPGIYTVAESGIGEGSILHSDYSEVSASSPAVPNETVQMFLTGLGPVTPQVADGAAAPSSPLSVSAEAAATVVYVGDEFVPAQVAFAGLAPGFAGLYQVNFTVPGSGLTNGDNGIAFGTTEALNQMATINVSGFSGRTAQTAPSRRNTILRRRAIVAGAHGKHAKDFRRALPERP